MYEDEIIGKITDSNTLKIDYKSIVSDLSMKINYLNNLVS